ncbi:hypothetical protein Tco_0761511 [Tanacetum coccineum]
MKRQILSKMELSKSSKGKKRFMLMKEAEALRKNISIPVSTIDGILNHSKTNFHKEDTLEIPGQQESNQNTGTKDKIDAGDSEKEDEHEIPPLEDIHEDTTDGIFTHSSYDDEKFGNSCEC